MMIQLQCPHCGNIINYDDTRDFMFCQNCGTKVSNKPMTDMIGGGVAQPRVNTATAPNVVVDYSTTRPEYPLTLVVDGERWTFPNNSRKEFTLSPGVHTVLFYVARRGWKKIVNVPYGNYPVHISVVYAGRVKIFIQ